jgi:hypothetical protein
MKNAIALIENIHIEEEVTMPVRLSDKAYLHDFYNGEYLNKGLVQEWVKKVDGHWGRCPYVVEVKGNYDPKDFNNITGLVDAYISTIRLVEYNRAFLYKVLFFEGGIGPNPIISKDGDYPLFFGKDDKLSSADCLRISDTIDRVIKNAKNKKMLMAIRYWNLSSCSSNYENTVIQLFIALESLLTTGDQEVTYKLAHRFAWLSTDDPNKRFEIFNKIKKGYDIRSKTVHGEKLVERNELDLIREIHSLSRDLILKILSNQKVLDLFTGKRDGLDEFYNHLTLGITPPEMGR